MINLEIPGSAVRPASVARHVTDCPSRPGVEKTIEIDTLISKTTN